MRLDGILPDRLREGLTPAERQLLERVAGGEEADFSSPDESQNDPAQGAAWGPERTIRAALLHWLCTDPQAAACVPPKGIRIRGARIQGPLDFEGATLPHRLFLIRCAIPEGILLTDARTRRIDLSGSYTQGLHADGLIVDGALILSGLICTGEVRLEGAHIQGQLSCRGARLENPNGDALRAERSTVEESVFLDGLELNGGLNFQYARLGVIVDDEGSWPQRGRLRIDGLEYEGFAGDRTPMDARRRLEWLRRQLPDFRPQPYDQLAQVFRRMGLEAEAVEVMIAKQEDLIRYGKLSRWSKLTRRVLGITIGHGYRSGRALL